MVAKCYYKINLRGRQITRGAETGGDFVIREERNINAL